MNHRLTLPYGKIWKIEVRMRWDRGQWYARVTALAAHPHLDDDEQIDIEGKEFALPQNVSDPTLSLPILRSLARGAASVAGWSGGVPNENIHIDWETLTP